MKDRTFLQKRKNGYYYFRKRLSPEIQNIVGKTEIIKSLNTTDKNEAIKLSSKLETKFYEFVDHVKSGTRAIKPNINISNQISFAAENLIKEENDKIYTLKDILEKWIKQNKPSYQAISESKLCISRFEELFGNITINAITIKHILTFRDVISAVPAKYNLKSPELSLIKAYEKYKDKSVSSLPKNSTITKKIATIKSLLSFAVNNGLIPSNPALNIKVSSKKTDSLTRMSFNSEDIAKIFNSEPMNKKDYRFWIAYIGLHTGARLEEIGQLLKSDIKQESGVYYFDINAEECKKLKTKTSVRKIPVHKRLIDAGFLDYINSIKSEKLFPELKAGTSGRLTKGYSQWFARHLQKVGICDSSKVFHSFRHGFKEACRNAEIPEEISDLLTGHSNGSFGRGYGAGHKIEVLNKWIQKIN
jgi:integrase